MVARAGTPAGSGPDLNMGAMLEGLVHLGVELRAAGEGHTTLEASRRQTMIAIYNDHLVPPELCKLLHQVVPKRHHVPVRFHNWRRRAVYGDRGRYPSGVIHLKGG